MTLDDLHSLFQTRHGVKYERAVLVEQIEGFKKSIALLEQKLAPVEQRLSDVEEKIKKAIK